MVSELKQKVKELETEIETWKGKYEQLKQEGGVATGSEGGGAEEAAASDLPEDVKELQMDLKVWKEKYKALKKKVEAGGEQPAQPSGMDKEAQRKIENLKKYTEELEGKINQLKNEKAKAIRIAEKTIAEYKKIKR
jgi:outer membrane murein-binding lipoprotein Lpp